MPMKLIYRLGSIPSHQEQVQEILYAVPLYIIDFL